MIGSPARDTLDRREQRIREIGRELLGESDLALCG